MTRKTLIALCSAAAVLLAALVAFNVLFGINFRLIMASFSMDNTDFDNEKVDKALALGDELVQNIAEEGIVLLENKNDTLPLSERERKVNLFGYGSSDAGFLLTGGGSGRSEIENKSNLGKKITLAAAFEKEGFECNRVLARIYTEYSEINMDADNARMILNEPDPSVYTAEVIAQAREFSDVAVVVISRFGRESWDIPFYQEKYAGGMKDRTVIDKNRTYLQLSVEEENMLEIVCGNFGTVIVIVNAGNTPELGFLQDRRIDAALSVGFPGQSGVLAVPRILKGSVTPSGALTTTFAYDRRVYDPTAANVFRGVLKDSQITYAEDIYIGYRWYETADAERFFEGVTTEWGEGYDGVVQYPFGYGLSYTDFAWKVDEHAPKKSTDLAAGGKATLKVTVANIGKRPGRDVVQVYGTPQYTKGGIEKAEMNLLAFAKTRELAPGDFQQLTLTFDAYDMASYDAYDKNGNGFRGYELDAGKYTVRLMRDVRTAAECLNAEIVYDFAEPVKFRRDPVTKAPVRNRFTGDTAYADVPIDGGNAGALPVTYLSRADFAGTFPFERTPDRNKTTVIEKANAYVFTGHDSVAAPVMSSGGKLRLVTKRDGSSASLADLKGDTGEDLVYNAELVTALGSDYEEPRWASLLDQLSAEELCTLVEAGGFQTAAAESIGKPRRRDSDGSAGFNLTSSYGAPAKWTAYPNQTLLGSTWNTSLAYDMGRAQGIEAAATNISGWYAPYLNMPRSQFGGRCFESCGEDPLHSGLMCAAVVRGAKNLGLYSYVKHFAVCEEGVNPDNLKTWLTEQTLREIYLKPFEIAVKKGGANAVMTAFNCIGAVWAGANSALNDSILRGEWGFRGSVVTDYSYDRDFMIAEKAIRGGNDFMLDPSASYSRISRTDPVSLYCARLAAKNILYTWANTYAVSAEYAASGGGEGFDPDLSLRPAPLTFSPAPVIMLVMTDALIVGGLTLIAVCIYRKRSMP